MLEAASGRGFDAETSDVFLAGERPEEDHLDGNETIEAGLARLVNDAHAAPRDFFDQFVVADLVEGRKRGGGRVHWRG